MLANDCYYPTGHTPWIFHHLAQPTTTNLVVDDFCAKNLKPNADHIINTFKNYNVIIDWNGESICGIKLKWDYNKKTVDLSTPNYFNKDLAHLNHSPTIKSQHYPHPYYALVYGQKHQFVIPTITNKKLTSAQLRNCQELCGCFIYYYQAIGNTMETAINTITPPLLIISWNALKFWINHFLDYASTHPKSNIRYH